MNRSKKFISAIMAVLMVLSVFNVGLVAFAANDVQLDPVELVIMDRPTVSFVTSGMTRVAAAVNSQAIGTTIVKATPSGVPELAGEFVDQAYAGETPVATTVTFSAPAEVVPHLSNISIACTNGATDLVLSEPVGTSTSLTWAIVSGQAEAGDSIEFTVTYDYKGRTYTSRCYSYVENIAVGGTKVRTEAIYSHIATLHRYFAIVSMSSRILGRGVKDTLSSNEGTYGYYNVATDEFVTDAVTPGYATVFHEFKGTTKDVTQDVNTPIYRANVYIDTSTVSNLADLNLRFVVKSNKRDAINDYPGEPLTLNESAVMLGLQGASSGAVNETAVANAIGYNPTGVGSRHDENALIMNTQFTGAVSNLYDGAACTIINKFYANNKESWWGEAKNNTNVPTQIVFNLVDKSSLRSTINTVLTTEPTSPLVSNMYKGNNPQSWYYKSGYTQFKEALQNAMAVLSNETATQNDIDTAESALTTMYTNLVFNPADYTKVSSLLEQADAALENKDYYTEDSMALLNEAYDGVKNGYNILYQSAVDTMAKNLQTALDNLEYAPADYAKVEEAKTAADVAAITAHIDANADKSYTVGDQVIPYYTDEFKANVDTAEKAVEDAVNAVVYGLDISKQAEVDGYATAINDAYTALSAMGADYTAVNALKTYAMGLKQTNYVSFTAVRTAVNKIRTGYAITRQADVDAVAEEIVAAINALTLKPATKTPLGTALALTPEHDKASYEPTKYAAWEALVAEGQAMYDDATLTILDNDAIKAKAEEITAAFNALEVIAGPADLSPLEEALALTPDYDLGFYTDETADAYTAAVEAGQAIMDKADTLNEHDNDMIKAAADEIVAKLGALALADADTSALEIAVALTPEYAVENYTEETYNAFTALVAEGNELLAREDLTSLDTATLNAKAEEITTAFGALALKAADTSALEEAVALVPEYEADFYVPELLAAFNDAVAEGNAILAREDLTILDNAAIAEAADKIVAAFEALDTVGADYTAFNEAVVAFEAKAETATLKVVTYAEGGVTGEEIVANYTEASIAAVREYIDACAKDLKIQQQQVVVDYVAEIIALTEAMEEVVIDTYLEAAIAEFGGLNAKDYTDDTWTVYADAVAAAEGAATQADINTAVEAIAAARLALEEIEFFFIAQEGTTTVIDKETGFIYGLEEGIVDLEDFVDYEGCELEYTYTDAGFGTGSKVDVIVKGEVIESYYIVIFGDVTGDGYVDSFDVTEITQVANYEKEFEAGSAYEFAGDVAGGDYFVDSFDLTLVTAASNYETVISQTR